MNFDHSHKRTRDADEQAASVHDWDQRYEQLSAGRFDGVVDELRVGPVQVFAEHANQTVMQAGHLSPGRMSIALVRADVVESANIAELVTATGEELVVAVRLAEDS